MSWFSFTWNKPEKSPAVQNPPLPSPPPASTKQGATQASKVARPAIIQADDHLGAAAQSLEDVFFFKIDSPIEPASPIALFSATPPKSDLDGSFLATLERWIGGFFIDLKEQVTDTRFLIEARSFCWKHAKGLAAEAMVTFPFIEELFGVEEPTVDPLPHTGRIQQEEYSSQAPEHISPEEVQARLQARIRSWVPPELNDQDSEFAQVMTGVCKSLTDQVTSSVKNLAIVNETLELILPVGDALVGRIDHGHVSTVRKRLLKALKGSSPFELMNLAEEKLAQPRRSDDKANTKLWKKREQWVLTQLKKTDHLHKAVRCEGTNEERLRHAEQHFERKFARLLQVAPYAAQQGSDPLLARLERADCGKIEEEALRGGGILIASLMLDQVKNILSRESFVTNIDLLLDYLEPQVNRWSLVKNMVAGVASYVLNKFSNNSPAPEVGVANLDPEEKEAICYLSKILTSDVLKNDFVTGLIIRPDVQAEVVGQINGFLATVLKAEGENGFTVNPHQFNEHAHRIGALVNGGESAATEKEEIAKPTGVLKKRRPADGTVEGLRNRSAEIVEWPDHYYWPLCSFLFSAVDALIDGFFPELDEIQVVDRIERQPKRKASYEKRGANLQRDLLRLMKSANERASGEVCDTLGRYRAEESFPGAWDKLKELLRDREPLLTAHLLSQQGKASAPVMMQSALEWVVQHHGAVVAN